ncbi:MAG TPA: SDR family oxidoreductase [Gemmatimonadales bacterium]|nr:SDR family oxidoreductase [Gemmatimonadales bacterium]
MQPAGRVALVTGAGRRLGRAMAAALAERGMTLGIHHNASAAGAEELRARIVAAGGKAECFAADLTDPHAARELPRRVAEALGGLDLLVNSSAVMHRIGFEDTTPEQYDAVLDLNLRAVFFCTQGAAPYLRRAGGKVVNMADLAGLQPWPGFAAHSLSKAGVVMLTKVLARALAPEVAVNAIAPGAVLVPEEYDAEERERLARSTPLRRLGSPDDAVGALLYLVEADFVTGHVLVVDGGRLLG